MPRVSVIVPTYNRRDCLVETLRTALNQSYRDFEILVVDDGSTDESAVEVLRQLGPDPQRAESIWRQHTAASSGACGFSFWKGAVLVQYIFQTNRGIGAARNRGLQAVQGEYVAFLEPEYAWDPHHLERHMEFLEECGEAWAAHGRVTQGKPAPKSAKRKTRSAPTPIPFEEVVAGNDLHTSAMVIRRRCLLAHGCFDENIPACEDYDLWVRIAAHVPIHHIPDSIVHVKLPPAVSSWNLDRYRVYALEKAFQSGHFKFGTTPSGRRGDGQPVRQPRRGVPEAQQHGAGELLRSQAKEVRDGGREARLEQCSDPPGGARRTCARSRRGR